MRIPVNVRRFAWRRAFEESRTVGLAGRMWNPAADFRGRSSLARCSRAPLLPSGKWSGEPRPNRRARRLRDLPKGRARRLRDLPKARARKGPNGLSTNASIRKIAENANTAAINRLAGVF